MSPLSTGRAVMGILTLQQVLTGLKIALKYVNIRRQFKKDKQNC